MRTLEIPSITPAEVLTACISGTEDPDLKMRLTDIKASLLLTAETYHIRANSECLHLFERVNAVGFVTKEELSELYSKQMSNNKGGGRSFYNFLRNSATKCPLCGIGTVTVLDHHLPKSKYPDLAVCPTNLVPACDYCNNAKRAKYPSTTGQQTIHPYYDDFTSEQWIFAKLNTLHTPSLKFFCSPPSHWEDTKKQRAQRHFEVVKLEHNYAANAADDIITLRDQLLKISENNGADGVKVYLDGEVYRHKSRPNSWQHAMYQALAKDIWFVSGGHKKIAL